MVLYAVSSYMTMNDSCFGHGYGHGHCHREESSVVDATLSSRTQVLLGSTDLLFESPLFSIGSEVR